MEQYDSEFIGSKAVKFPALIRIAVTPRPHKTGLETHGGQIQQAQGCYCRSQGVPPPPPPPPPPIVFAITVACVLQSPDSMSKTHGFCCTLRISWNLKGRNRRFLPFLLFFFSFSLYLYLSIHSTTMILFICVYFSLN